MGDKRGVPQPELVYLLVGPFCLRSHRRRPVHIAKLLRRGRCTAQRVPSHPPWPSLGPLRRSADRPARRSDARCRGRRTPGNWPHSGRLQPRATAGKPAQCIPRNQGFHEGRICKGKVHRFFFTFVWQRIDWESAAKCAISSTSIFSVPL